MIGPKAIVHPNLLPEAESKIASTFRLYRQSKIPDTIEPFMLAVPLKFGLRAIYGSDWLSGWSLITDAVEHEWDMRVGSHLWKIRCSSMWALAWIWTQAWGWSRVIFLRWPRGWAFCWGRHTSPEPVRCEDCGWSGPRRRAHHGYNSCGWDDQEVEPSDECPLCGTEV